MAQQESLKPETNETPTKSKSRVWFFVVIVVLVTTSITTLIVYNLNQLLTQAEVESAFERWKQAKINDYGLYFEIRHQGQPLKPTCLTTPGDYIVRVQNGEVQFVSRDGVALPSSTYGQFTMEAIYKKLILRNLEKDRREGSHSTFTRGIFHQQDGHLQWYVRRVSGTRNRVELIMKDFRTKKQKRDTSE